MPQLLILLWKRIEHSLLSSSIRRILKHVSDMAHHLSFSTTVMKMSLAYGPLGTKLLPVPSDFGFLSVVLPLPLED
jgi:hypothetical protein